MIVLLQLPPLKKQQNHGKHNTRQCKIKPFFKNAGTGHEHPERGYHKEQQGCCEKNIQVIQWILGTCLVQMGKFFNKWGQCFSGIGYCTRFPIVTASFKQLHIAANRIYFQFAIAYGLAKFSYRQTGLQLLAYQLFFFQKIGIPENKDGAADGIHGHNAC